jgi:adenosylhomocysteine nucleosidase
MRVLVTFAVDAEFAPWRKLRKFRKASSKRYQSSSYVGEIGDHLIEVILTGIGKAACQAALIEIDATASKKPDLLISSGFAGALRDPLRPGDLIIPRKARTLKNDANADADAGFSQRAVGQGALSIETLITVDRVVHTASEKGRLAFFGEAVDMESAIIMSAFAAAAVPAITIRVISDAPDEDLPIDFDRCLNPQGGVKPLSLVNAIVGRPQKLPKLIRFGQQSNMAAARLARFLDGFVLSILQPKERVAV